MRHVLAAADHGLVTGECAQFIPQGKRICKATDEARLTIARPDERFRFVDLSACGQARNAAFDLSLVYAADAGCLAHAVNILHRGLLHRIHAHETLLQIAPKQLRHLGVGNEVVSDGKNVCFDF